MILQENKHCLNWAVEHGQLAGPVDGANIAASLVQDYRLLIHPDSVKMYLRTEIYSDDAYLAAMEVAAQQGFKYTYTPTAIKMATLHAGHTSLEMTNIAGRSNAVLMAHTFVDHEAHNGSKRRNAYLFRGLPTLSKMVRFSRNKCQLTCRIRMVVDMRIYI